MPDAGDKQLDAVFIEVEVDDAVASDPEIAAKLEEVCPVDIFATAGGGAAEGSAEGGGAPRGTLEIVEENLDECVLCELCIEAAPPGAVEVRKLYDGTSLKR